MDPDMAKEVQSKLILHWNYRGFSELPKELKQNGDHVEDLYLKWNNLSSVPQWVGRLHSLSNLYLYANCLTKLPEEIGEVSTLETLDVGQNQLVELPVSIGKLKKLKTLNAVSNNLLYIPSELGQLSSLVHLQLSKNYLTALPPDVRHCRNLGEIGLDGNKFSTVPQEVVYLPKLEILSMVDNDILYLPSLPFISKPRIFLDSNRHLNYIPYPVGCQIHEKNGGRSAGLWNLEIYGCFQDTSYTTSSSYITVQLPGAINRDAILTIPKHFTLLNNSVSGSIVPSLYELSIRIVYQIIYKHSVYMIRDSNGHNFEMQWQPQVCFESWNIFLPKCICMHLVTGPIAICFHPKCQTPIFLYGAIWVISKQVHVNNVTTDFVPSTLLFCCKKCSDSYTQCVLNEQNDDWEQALVRSRLVWY